MSPASPCKDLAIIPPQIKSVYTIVVTGFDIAVKVVLRLLFPRTQHTVGVVNKGLIEMRIDPKRQASSPEGTVLPGCNQ